MLRVELEECRERLALQADQLLASKAMASELVAVKVIGPPSPCPLRSLSRLEEEQEQQEQQRQQQRQQLKQ